MYALAGLAAIRVRRAARTWSMAAPGFIEALVSTRSTVAVGVLDWPIGSARTPCTGLPLTRTPNESAAAAPPVRATSTWTTGAAEASTRRTVSDDGALEGEA